MYENVNQKKKREHRLVCDRLDLDHDIFNLFKHDSKQKNVHGHKVDRSV